MKKLILVGIAVAMVFLMGCDGDINKYTLASTDQMAPPDWIQGTWTTTEEGAPSFIFSEDDISMGGTSVKAMISALGYSVSETEKSATVYEFDLTMSSGGTTITVTYHFAKGSDGTTYTLTGTLAGETSPEITYTKTE